jgi:hypothetical protein
MMMSRPILIAVPLLLAPLVLLGARGPSSGRVGPQPKAQDTPVGLERRVDFTFRNARPTDSPLRIHVEGEGVLPIRATVQDLGGANRVRRLQAVVVVYQADRQTGRSPTTLVGVYPVDGVMVSPPTGDSSQRCDVDIQLPPGRYAFYLLVCDPDQPIRPEHAAVMEKAYEPRVIRQLPGRIKRGTLCTAEVRPG